ncbi:hypothetical protein PIB30_060458, partial [Stylosanthes scabra]|nr:hypothetical protein [Stylosanthes scabra]
IREAKKRGVASSKLEKEEGSLREKLPTQLLLAVSVRPLSLLLSRPALPVHLNHSYQNRIVLVGPKNCSPDYQTGPVLQSYRKCIKPVLTRDVVWVGLEWKTNLIKKLQCHRIIHGTHSPIPPSVNLISSPPSLTVRRRPFLTAVSVCPVSSAPPSSSELPFVVFFLRAVFLCLDAGPKGLRRSSFSSPSSKILSAGATADSASSTAVTSLVSAHRPYLAGLWTAFASENYLFPQNSATHKLSSENTSKLTCMNINGNGHALLGENGGKTHECGARMWFNVVQRDS